MRAGRSRRRGGRLAAVVIACAVSSTGSLAPVLATDLIGGAQPHMLTPEEAQKAFVLPAEYQVNLFASEADFPIQSPAAMTFDSLGRLWVSCVKSHPHALPGVEPRDSLIVLEDTDKDGVADKSTVFYDKLYLPMGFALADHGRTVYIVSEPNLLRLTDADGDLVADEARIELHGLGTEDNHHVASAFQWGPDGRLYFGQGLFLNTQIETPHGPVRAYEAAVFRFDPRDHRLEIHGSYGWSNPWGIIFDHWGQPLLADASPALDYYMPYMTSNFDYPKPDIYDNYTKVRNQYSFTPPNRRPSCGNELLLSEHFPEEVRGWYVTNQMKGWHGIRWYKLHDEGAGYGSTQPRGEEELLTTTDITFRPTALQLGPDGALYALDYYNPIVGHMTYNFRDPRRIQTHGRVWRITHRTRSLVWQPDIDGEPVAALLDHLKNANYRTRYFARREIQERAAEEVVPAVRTWVAAQSPEDPGYEHHLAEALWVYQGLNHYDFDLLRRLLGARDHNARTAGARVLRFWQEKLPPGDSLALIKAAIEDASQRVRLEALLACGYHAAPGEAMKVAALALKREMDTGFRLAAGDTLDHLAGRVEEVPPEVDLFLLPRKTDEELLAKSLNESVCEEILRRPQLVADSHMKAIRWLAQNHGMESLGYAVQKLLEDDESGEMSATIPRLLRDWPDLEAARDQVEEAVPKLIASPAATVRQHAFAALMKLNRSGKDAVALALKSGPSAEADLMKGIVLLGGNNAPPDLYGFVSERLGSKARAVRTAAAEAISNFPARHREALDLLAKFSEETAAVDLGLSFAALDSMSRIPKNLWPPDYSNKTLTKTRITATPDLKFDPVEFQVPAGGAVDLEFYNPDNMYHNLAIVRPGSDEEVGLAADAMAATPEGLEKNYVPESKAILHWTPQIGLRKVHRLQFFAPLEPGDYPYICTFPGHWRVMRGVMRVVPSGERAASGAGK